MPACFLMRDKKCMALDGRGGRGGREGERSKGSGVSGGGEEVREGKEGEKEGRVAGLCSRPRQAFMQRSDKKEKCVHTEHAPTSLSCHQSLNN